MPPLSLTAIGLYKNLQPLQDIAAPDRPQVYRAENSRKTNTGVQSVVLKAGQTRAAEIAIRHEVTILSHIQSHPLGVVRLKPTKTNPLTYHKFDPKSPGRPIYFVMEDLGDETLYKALFARRKHRPPLNLKDWLSLYLDMLYTVHALHKIGITHGDLKPSNIMLWHSLYRVQLILIDFASASYNGTPPPVKTGTKPYAPPEAYLQTSHPTTQWDIHALGIVLWEMIMLQRYNPDCKPEDIRQAQVESSSVRYDLSTLVSEMLAEQADTRPDVIKVIEKLTPILSKLAR